MSKDALSIEDLLENVVSAHNQLRVATEETVKAAALQLTQQAEQMIAESSGNLICVAETGKPPRIMRIGLATGASAEAEKAYEKTDKTSVLTDRYRPWHLVVAPLEQSQKGMGIRISGDATEAKVVIGRPLIIAPVNTISLNELTSLLKRESDADCSQIIVAATALGINVRTIKLPEMTRLSWGVHEQKPWAVYDDDDGGDYAPTTPYELIEAKCVKLKGTSCGPWAFFEAHKLLGVSNDLSVSSGARDSRQLRRPTAEESVWMIKKKLIEL